MQILNNPITKSIANALSNITPGSPLDDALEFLGITNPEKLGELATADSLGDATEALYESLGYDHQVSAALGIATDVATGDVQGAVSNGAEETLGDSGAATAAELAGRLDV